MPWITGFTFDHSVRIGARASLTRITILLALGFLARSGGTKRAEGHTPLVSMMSRIAQRTRQTSLDVSIMTKGAWLALQRPCHIYGSPQGTGRALDRAIILRSATRWTFGAGRKSRTRPFVSRQTVHALALPCQIHEGPCQTGNTLRESCGVGDCTRLTFQTRRQACHIRESARATARA
mgnify:CR=1 FL=1